VNAKEFYLFLYSIALKTLSLVSPLIINLILVTCTLQGSEQATTISEKYLTGWSIPGWLSEWSRHQWQGGDTFISQVNQLVYIANILNTARVSVVEQEIAW